MKNVIITFLSSSNRESNFPDLVESKDLPADKFVFYDNYIPAKDFTATTHRPYLQLGAEKSERLMNAFLKAFLKNYESVIYFDPEFDFITGEIIKEAFEVLAESSAEVVIFGDKLGNVKLLGMKSLKPEIFEKLNIKQMVAFLNNSGISYSLISNRTHVSKSL